MVKKCLLWVVLFLWLCGGGVFCVAAEDTADIDETLDAYVDAIPPEVADNLFAQGDGRGTEDFAAAVGEYGTARAVFHAVLAALGVQLPQALSLCATLFAVLVPAAIFRTVAAGGLLSEPQRRAIDFCAVAALGVVVLRTVLPHMQDLQTYFEVLKNLDAAMVPLMGALYAMGGNIGAAAANHTVMTAFLSILEVLCSGTVMPVAGICLALAVAEAAHGGLSLRPLAAFLKKTYTLCLSFLMLLLCGVLGIQTTLAKGSDTLALRTVRFAAGSFLPVVGGSVSEALRTVAGSVQYLRGVVGIGGIVVLFYCFLPVLLTLLLMRAAFSLCAAAASMLGGEREHHFLSECAGVYGYFLAVAASLFVMNVFALSLLSHCTAAG